MADLAEGIAFSIYPNPASDQLFIEVQDGNEAAMIELLTLDVKVIVSVKDQNQIDISILQAGIYLVSVKCLKGGSVVGKWVKRGVY